MKRNSRRRGNKVPALNLTALMDIFTILVFFLLVNSSSVPQPNSDGLRLPKAKVEKPIEETLVIQINSTSILVQDKPIVELTDELLNSEDNLIPALVTELSYRAKRSPLPEPTAAEPDPVRIATLMADREIPFKLLKKIMASAGESDYGQLSLAVIGQAQDAD